MEKVILGRTDIADFPKLDLFGIPVKIDTGAYTSSIHCHNMHVEKGILICQFLDPKHEEYHNRTFYFSEFQEKNVKSSNGQVEKRYSIKTKIVLFERIFSISLTLAERSEMRFPVLLGRKFITKKFIIDTAQKELSFHKKISK